SVDGETPLPGGLNELNVQFSVPEPWGAGTWSGEELIAGYFMAYQDDGGEWLHEMDHDRDDSTEGILSITLEDAGATRGTLTALAFPSWSDGRDGDPIEIDMRWADCRRRLPRAGRVARR